ncbi:TRAP transporter substrate-binding protein [Alkalihalobacillus oceani]|uniref:TRAP transporter substrate-binding protein n=1 Tax=Halalkalibacter oceani TaxID=1653776 RepID=A0A9X2DSL9_9BACI|nr:TRAP transporter substrate-binding protein [Halalkalibacter oceani]MCM3714820.1 TRAP transporter substrate-binding protein [Halalkalibacter oceani]
MKVKLVSVLMVLVLFLAACGGGGGNEPAPADNGGDAPAETEGGEEAAAGSGDKRVIRVSNGINDQHPAYEASLRFKELVEEQTDDFEVQVYHSGQIADDRSAIEMLQLGTLEIVVTSSSPLANFLPEYGVFDLPFTISDPAVADELLDGPFGEKMFGLLESQGLVGLAWWENGFRNLTNSVRPVASVEDLNGLKIRTMENEIHLDAWREMGANPTPMAFTELFTAMQQGTVDGQENPYPTIDLSQYAEVQEHISDTNHVYTPFLFLFSKSIWDELSADQQTIIHEAAIEAGLFNRERNREVADESLERLKESMTFTEITDEERARFQEVVQPVIEKHKDSIGAEIVDEYLNTISEITGG